MPNQCDGCLRGIPVVNNVHKNTNSDNPWDIQYCTKNRYDSKDDCGKIVDQCGKCEACYIAMDQAAQAESEEQAEDANERALYGDH